MSQGEEPVSQNEIDSLLNQTRRKSDSGAGARVHTAGIRPARHMRPDTLSA